MKKRVLIALVAVLVLAATASLVWAGGPAKKATGSVEIVPLSWSDTKYRYIEFNVHESMGDRPEKGWLYWTLDDGFPTRTFTGMVKYVNVDVDVAYFAGVIVYSSESDWVQEGWWWHAKVHDGSTPGSENDVFWFNWVGAGEATAANYVITGEQPTYMFDVTDGNLVVHTYE